MTKSIRWIPNPTIKLRLLAILAMLLTMVAGLAAPVHAQSDTTAPVDISLITRNPDDGSPLMGTCYELVDFSNQGCDEDSDGQVTFAQIPPGAYTVRQTQAPEGFPAINEFEIQVEAPYPGGAMGIVVKQAPEQNAPDTRNFSVILIDASTGQRFVSDICVELVSASAVGCDDDLRDGQIDFLDVPVGEWALAFTNLGDDWVIGNGPSDVVRIDAAAEAPTSQSIVRGVFRVAAPEPSPAVSTEGATLNITLRGCPEGIDPNTSDPATQCTVPLDAPPEAGAIWGGDGQGGIPMTDVTRLDDGTYQVNAPANAPIELINFGPTEHDTYLAFGVDAINENGNPVIQLAPGTTGQVSIYYYFTGDTTDTWDASVQVMMCEGEMDCHGEAGIVVNISLASGEFLGSCTLSEPSPTPWGVAISTCSVPGMPFNTDLVATQEPSTIPAGYMPSEETLSLHVDNLIPGGGDQATFTFVNMRNDGGSTESSQATLHITMRGCPDGFNPTTGDFFAECTVPLDAPDAAVIIWGGDGQGGMEIMNLDRQNDGAYVYEAGPNTMNLSISGLAPVVRDDFEVFGIDSGDGSTFTINLTNGEVREVYVFYYDN